MGRRPALLGLGAVASLGLSGLPAAASLALGHAAGEQRLVVVILRGALDGLAAVPPYGDPDLAALRPELIAPPPGQPGGLLDLGGRFGLHPALSGLHGLYERGELLVVHAVAGDWRTRSHFEAQDHLEIGSAGPVTGVGWMNRIASLLPRLPDAKGEPAVSVGGDLPLLLRGPTPVGIYQPQALGNPPPDLYAQIAQLHHDDAVTGPALASGLRERGFTHDAMAGYAAPKEAHGFALLAAAAGRLLADPAGPRLAALELGGWDTHAGQNGRLAGALHQLDEGLLALHGSLGPVWARTVVLVLTEFGRTVRANGTHGTDHGTGSVAFVLGGPVLGGRVLRDWPGLSSGKLLDGRDLAPTTDMHGLTRSVVRAHLGLSDHDLAAVFPDRPAASEVAGVLRA